MGYGGTKEYVQALRDIVVAIMIEKPGTVDTLAEVLSVKGVDMVQWGGSDYSMGIGRAGERYCAGGGGGAENGGSVNGAFIPPMLLEESVTTGPLASESTLKP